MHPGACAPVPPLAAAPPLAAGAGVALPEHALRNRAAVAETAAIFRLNDIRCFLLWTSPTN
jgi:hypothetical protein